MRIPHLHNKALPTVYSPIKTSPLDKDRCSNYLKAHQEFCYPRICTKLLYVQENDVLNTSDEKKEKETKAQSPKYWVAAKKSSKYAKKEKVFTSARKTSNYFLNILDMLKDVGYSIDDVKEFSKIDFSTSAHSNFNPRS